MAARGSPNSNSFAVKYRKFALEISTPSQEGGQKGSTVAERWPRGGREVALGVSVCVGVKLGQHKVH